MRRSAVSSSVAPGLDGGSDRSQATLCATTTTTTNQDETNHHPRNSLDSASRLATSSLYATSSPISPDNFSNPALAEVSPRRQLQRRWWVTSSSAVDPRLPPARDHGSPSPTTTTTTTTIATTTTSSTTSTRSTARTLALPPSPSTTLSTAPGSKDASSTISHRRVTSSRSITQKPASSSSSPPNNNHHNNHHHHNNNNSSSNNSNHNSNVSDYNSREIRPASARPPSLATHRSQTDASPPIAVANRDTLSRPRPRDQAMGLDSVQLNHAPRPSSSIDGIRRPTLDFDNAATTTTTTTSTSSTALRDRRQRASFPARSALLSRERDRTSAASTIPRLNGTLRRISDPPEREESISPESTSRDLSGEESKKSEDVFLNLAKDAANRRDSLTKTERRRTTGLYGLPSRLRANGDTPSPARTELDDDSPLVHHDHSCSTHRSPRSVDESSRLRYVGSGGTRSSLGAATRSRLGRAESELAPDMSSQVYSERRGSMQERSALRDYRQPYLGASRSSRALSGADGTEHARLEAERARREGTESTLSTTAPSTVWDELDELRSRIRKLELTGRFPASSAAAMSSIAGDRRPRTATTTVATTMSSSPQRARRASSPPLPPDTTEAAHPPLENQIHNLLRTALSKAKPRLSSPVYLTLEAAANDALALSTMLHAHAAHASSGLSVVNGASGSDRQMRRKADSVCRSLTELCLALSEDQPPVPASNPRPSSRDATSTVRLVNGRPDTDSATPTLTYRRSASHEPEDPPRSQVSFNLAPGSHGLPEGRRRSMLNLSSTANHASDDGSESPSTVKLPTPPSRLSRSTTLLRSRRIAPEEGEYGDKLAAPRPVSRAMTEATLTGPKERLLARDRPLLGHSSSRAPGVENQPLPSRPSATTTTTTTTAAAAAAAAATATPSSIPLRRHYAASSTSHLATTSPSSIQPGFRRYTAGASAVGLRASLDRDQDRISPKADVPDPPQVDLQPRGSLGLVRGSTLQPLRTRTNSIGARRIGIRPRQTPANNMDPDGID